MDTDIAGARAAQLPSLMVLTGVSTAAEMVHAIPAERPDYVGADLRALFEPAAQLAIEPQEAWRVEVDGNAVTVFATDVASADPLSVVRATAAAAWSVPDGRRAEVRAGDETAREALARWSLFDGADQLA